MTTLRSSKFCFFGLASFWLAFAPAVSIAGTFDGKRITIDVRSDPRQVAVNDGRRNLPPLRKGQKADLEFFIEGIAHGSTSGFTLSFDNSNLIFTDNLSIDGFEGLFTESRSAQGATIAPGGSRHGVGPDGFLGTLKVTAKRDIKSGTVLRLRPGSTTIFDSDAGVLDSLNVADAFVRFVSRIGFTASLDLDASPGDQRATFRNGVLAGQDVSIQVHASEIQHAVGYILRFEFDPDQVAFSGFGAGEILTSVQTLLPDTTASAVEVTAATFSGPTNLPSGLLGRVVFQTLETFSGSTVIRMSYAEILRGGEFIRSGPFSVSLNSVIDFDGNGRTDFRDFLLFASKFGATSTEPGFDARFDLNGDGLVGFSDFTILAAAIEATLNP